MSIIEPEALAARALRDWLLWKLPASCATINAARAAYLRAPGPGPYTIPASAVLKLGLTATTTNVSLTAGSHTTAQLVTEINTAMGATIASADTDDKLLLTSTTAPSFHATTLAPTNSGLIIGADTTGANVALGFERGGQRAVTTPVLPPGPDGVCDGFPVAGLFNPSALGKGRVLVTIGQRTSQPTQDNPRRFEWDTLLDCAVFRDEPQQVQHQTREGIQAALAAVRNTFLTDAGMQLGRPNEVMYARAGEVKVSPVSFKQFDQQGRALEGGLFFDAADFKFRARVFQQFP